ncbi:hypothetical protein [Streptomyces vinaceus]|uniref:hypothetical protein n=1 Tax=Streptomyces vinaceus TaxID=1960 RepID=UPI0035D6118A
MPTIKATTTITAMLVLGAGLLSATLPGTAMAAGTGYCLNSGGAGSTTARMYSDCSNTSDNLKWVIENGQIVNR